MDKEMSNLNSFVPSPPSSSNLSSSTTTSSTLTQSSFLSSSPSPELFTNDNTNGKISPTLMNLNYHDFYANDELPIKNQNDALESILNDMDSDIINEKGIYHYNIPNSMPPVSPISSSTPTTIVTHSKQQGKKNKEKNHKGDSLLLTSVPSTTSTNNINDGMTSSMVHIGGIENQRTGKNKNLKKKTTKSSRIKASNEKGSKKLNKRVDNVKKNVNKAKKSYHKKTNQLKKQLVKSIKERNTELSDYCVSEISSSNNINNNNNKSTTDNNNILLLAKTYAINLKNNKHLSIGFDSDTFNVTIQLIHNKKYVNLLPDDWIQLQYLDKHIKKYFINDGWKDKKDTTNQTTTTRPTTTNGKSNNGCSYSYRIHYNNDNLRRQYGQQPHQSTTTTTKGTRNINKHQFYGDESTTGERQGENKCSFHSDDLKHKLYTFVDDDKEIQPSTTSERKKSKVINNHVFDMSNNCDFNDDFSTNLFNKPQNIIKLRSITLKQFNIYENVLCTKVKLLKIESNIPDSKTNRKVKILLNEQEYNYIAAFFDYFTNVICKDQLLYQSIYHYYITYLNYCQLHQTKQLPSNFLFLPYYMDNGSTFNYSRLFYELPIICKKKLKTDLNKMNENLTTNYKK